MKSVLAPVAATLFAFALNSCSVGSNNSFPPGNGDVVLTAEASPKKTLRPFRSEQEFTQYLRKLAERQARKRKSQMDMYSLPLASKTVEAVEVSAGAAAKPESITNVQHAGVDEGGIVKLHGDHLVILRRGRLFTISLSDGLTPISSADAFSPDVDPRNTWYDEMLISGDTIVVIGYSYERGGTEASLFQINSAGQLNYRATYQLRSDDYYSSRNYSSRLIGTKLIFYAPLYFGWNGSNLTGLPAVRKWHKGAKPAEFRRIISATEIYRTPQFRSDDDAALHTVTTCELAQGDFDCKATSVLGPSGRVFYVSPNSVYVWTTDWPDERKKRAISTLYRMPLDGSAPTAIRVSGSPVDQFSFLESEEGQLNVLVRSDSAGDGMWRAEVAAGEIALLRVPLANFSDGSSAVPSSDYLPLPKVEGYDLQNRFVADYLLYGSGNGWGYPKKTLGSPLFLVRWTDGATSKLVLSHGTDRIEQMGRDAVVIGSDGRNLHFTSVHLGDSPVILDDYLRKEASQGELRSQGFFYKSNSEDTGTLGLPISTPGRPGYRHLFEHSAAILFLRNVAGHLSETGELAAQPEKTTDDKCRASCVDWYGNARALFIRDRIIALLGYELVEGRREGDRIEEIRRVNYSPEQRRADSIVLK